MTTYRILEPCSWTLSGWLDWDGTVEAGSAEEALEIVASDGGWNGYADWRTDGKPQLVAVPEDPDESDSPCYDGPRCAACGCPVKSGAVCSSCLAEAIAATERYEADVVAPQGELLEVTA